MGRPSKQPQSIQQHVADAERLALNNDRIVPNPRWLRLNGFEALDGAMRRSPASFAHLVQRRRNIRERKTIIEKVDVALQLAEQNGGILPHCHWLNSNGYGYLAMEIWKNPVPFANIPQDKKIEKFLSIEEHVVQAEALAHDNGGILPNNKLLRKKGYGALAKIMWKYPDRFSHLSQKRLLKTPKEHMDAAIKLSDDNGGILPHPKFLQQNGYSGLDRQLRQNPDLFSDIRQNRLKIILRGYVKNNFDDIAKENVNQRAVRFEPFVLRGSGRSVDIYFAVISCLIDNDELRKFAFNSPSQFDGELERHIDPNVRGLLLSRKWAAKCRKQRVRILARTIFDAQI